MKPIRPVAIEMLLWFALYVLHISSCACVKSEYLHPAQNDETITLSYSIFRNPTMNRVLPAMKMVLYFIGRSYMIVGVVINVHLRKMRELHVHVSILENSHIQLLSTYLHINTSFCCAYLHINKRPERKGMYLTSCHTILYGGECRFR